ncbi:lipase/acyltransferase domain-containing protein [Cysteiniphilum sp. JM-1]|uniref:lipase/acyltransferase domain-containing protein n=1 Tax=Cysteiniphilum sp. JM-1 TaxID=2610891 RepID=UPI00124450A1|nr:alpha/beta hydrolase [Cysteiniphilum sp. JM-1]
MDKIILGVHGLLNKNAKEVIQTWWKSAIEEGLEKTCGYDEGINFQMVYWADLLHKYPLHNDEAYYFDELYDDEPYYYLEKENFPRYADSLIKRMGLLGQNAVRKCVNLIQQYDPVSFWAANKLFRDMAYYYNDEVEIYDRKGQKRPLRKILMRELIDALSVHAKESKEIIVIGHSMGSIICYDVLRNIRSFLPDINIKCFITMGSPLTYAITYKHPFLELTDGHFRNKPRTPSAVQSWYNFSDPRDVACYRLKLGPLYGPNHQGVQVVDQLVFSDYGIFNKKLGKYHHNPHKSYGYLRCPEFSELIYKCLDKS